jgi:phage gp29-like protein
MDTYNSHPATGLTAEMLLSFYRQAERGYPVKMFDCFDDLVEVDGHLRGLLNGRIDGVAGCDWTIVPGRDDKPSRIAAEALDDHLRNRPELDFRHFVEHHLSSPHYGFAATNTVWDLVDGFVSPAEFLHAPHRRFGSPDPDNAHRIMFIDDNTTSPTRFDLVELIPGEWSLSQYRSRNPWAAGNMRTAGFWAMIKRWSVRDWQVFAEMFGLPLVLGFYDEAAGEASRLKLEAAIKAIGEDGYAVLSDLVEVVIKDTARSGDSSTVYPKQIALAEAQMSKLLAGSTTASDVGGDVGSYQLGVVHESRAYKLSLADARGIESTVRRYISVPWVQWNGMDRAAPPRHRIQITRDSLERAQTLEIVGQAVDLDPDQLYEEFSLRRPQQGKGVRMPTKTPAPAKPN